MTEVNHAQHQTHADHAAHTAEHGHAGHGDHVAQFRRMFWTMLVLAIPTVALSGMFAMILGYSRAGVPRIAMGVTGARHRDVPLGWPAVPHRCDQ